MSEHDEQAALIQWTEMIPEIRGRLFAIPNGGHRYKATAGKLKAEGVRPGYPDLALDQSEKGYNGLRIELKDFKKYPTPVQRDWLNYLNKNGYYAIWCMGWVEASDVIRWYIGMIEVEPKRRKI